MGDTLIQISFFFGTPEKFQFRTFPIYGLAALFGLEMTKWRRCYRGPFVVLSQQLVAIKLSCTREFWIQFNRIFLYLGCLRTANWWKWMYTQWNEVIRKRTKLHNIDNIYIIIFLQSSISSGRDFSPRLHVSIHLYQLKFLFVVTINVSQT
jgi:hypothetical protein